MKEVPITWLLAIKLYYRHISWANITTSIIAVLLYLIAAIVAKINGFPISKIPQSPWFMPAIIIILLVHFIPVNIWVLKKLFKRPTKEGYRMVLVKDKELSQ